jgi:hypothetical protein
VIIAIASGLLLAACGGDSPPGTTGPTKAEGPDAVALADAQNLWDQEGPSEYAFTATRACECRNDDAGPIRVHVADGGVVSSSYFGVPSASGPGTIEDIFDNIKASIARGERVDVAYDKVNGFPSTVKLDIESIPVDGGLDMTLTDLVAYDQQRADLAAARQAWESALIHNYSLTYRVLCFCPEIQVTIEVRDGALLDRTVEGAETVEIIDNVEDMFAQVEAAIDGGAFSVQVDYEPETGRPIRFFIDEEQFMADEEHGIEVQSLTLR